MSKIQEKNSKYVSPLKMPLKGLITVPADKSLSHRAAMFGAIAGGNIEIINYSTGGDCRSTLNVLQELGVEIKQENNKIFMNAKDAFKEPSNVLDAGNSGTTTRLMSGILSGQPFYSVITGDESLRSRPMARVIKPLSMMGAQIWARECDTKAPISIKGGNLQAIDYESPIASAQVKSAVLLAGLFADGVTSVTEPYVSRDHTERMLSYLGADLSIKGTQVSIRRSDLTPKALSIPGDISSAAFFMAAGAIIPDSEITIQNVGLNPTRTGMIDVLKDMGAEVEILNQRIECNENVGDIKVSYSNLRGITIDKEIIPRLVDELPVIAVMATQAEGTTVVQGAEDLRSKESDRIKTVCTELTKLGANIQETTDGFIIEGKTKLKGNCTIETYHDHRIAMSAYIAGLIADNPITINEFNWVNISFPEFVNTFDKLGTNK